MGYKVKWVEDNLGVSRKALRNFEKLGLMPTNEGGKYRDYSDEDIERIWTIRLFQGMGYSLKELVKMSENEDFDIDASLEKKIIELEREKEKIERHLGYAQAIRLTGRFPSRPKNMGSITFEEFHKKALNEWNVHSNSKMEKYQKLMDLIQNTPEENFPYKDLDEFLELLQFIQEQLSNTDALMMEKVIPIEILKRKEQGPASNEVQLLVKMLYETRINCVPELANMTQNQFVRLESSNYLYGNIAQIKEQEYSKDGCMFIANAIAVFGGYNCCDEIED